jgi:hypothetical protein
MKKAVLLMLSIVFIFTICGCGNPAEKNPAGQQEAAQSENKSADPAQAAVSPEAVAADPDAEPVSAIPENLVFEADGSGRYCEPVLGEWNAFLSRVFKDYDSGEIDPGSGITKYYGEGNDGHGYCFVVTTRSDKTGIISYNIDTAIVSEEPDSGGDEVSGQIMVQWMYENFSEKQ